MPSNLLQINPVALQQLQQPLNDAPVLQNANTLALQSPTTGSIFDPVNKAILGYQQAKAQEAAIAEQKASALAAQQLEQSRYDQGRADKKAVLDIEQKHYDAKVLADKNALKIAESHYLDTQKRQDEKLKREQSRLRYKSKVEDRKSLAALKVRQAILKKNGIEFDSSDGSLGLIDAATFKQIAQGAKHVVGKASFKTQTDDQGNVTAITMGEDGSFISKNLGRIGQTKTQPKAPKETSPKAPTEQQQAYVSALIARNPDASSAQSTSHFFSPDTYNNDQNKIHGMRISYAANTYMNQHKGVGFDQAVAMVKPALDQLERERIAGLNQ